MNRLTPNSKRVSLLAAITAALALILAACTTLTTVTIDFVGNGSGTVSVGGQTLSEDGTVQLNPSVGHRVVATAADGSRFAGFGGICSGATGDVCSIEAGDLSEGATVEVEFVSDAQLTLDLSGDGSGTVTVNGTAYTADATVDFPLGTELTIDATPDAGSTFDGFSEACSGATGTTCSVTIDGNITVGAAFGVVPPDSVNLTLELAGSGSGSVTIDSTDNGVDDGQTYTSSQVLSFTEGTVLAVSATADTGSTFDGFSGACTSEPCSFTIDSNATLTATFGLQAYDVTFDFQGDGSGSVDINGTSYTAGDTLSFDFGTALTITATADADNTFGGFLGDCASATGDTCDLTVDGAKSFTVLFTADGQATIAVTPGRGLGSGLVTSDVGGLDCTVDSETGATSGDCTVSINTTTTSSVTLNATADTGSAFLEYGGDCSGTDCTISLVDGETYTVSAAFGLEAAATQSVTIELQGDDAEEFESASPVATNFEAGEIDNNTRYLEITYTDKWETDQIIGLIFRDLDIPAGANITSAVIEFSPYDASQDGGYPGDPGFGAGSFDVEIELHNGATWPTTSVDGDTGGFPDGGDSAGVDNANEVNVISGFSVFGTPVPWNVVGSDWGASGGAVVYQETPDLSAALESWLDLGGYTQGSNAAVFRLSSDSSDASNYAIAATERGESDPQGTQPSGQRAPTLVVTWQ